MTTLEILRKTYKTMNIPFTDACREIGMSAQTGRNKLARGQFPLFTFCQGRRRYVGLQTLAAYLDRQTAGKMYASK